MRLLVGATVLLTAGAACAGGFNIYEAGAKATALGGAFTATADDGSAVFYNAAGLAFLEGQSLDLNLMPVIPSAEFTGATVYYSPGEPSNTPAAGKTVEQSFPIPGLYYYRNTGEFTLGLGLYAPFGLGVEWDDPDQWIGREVSYDVDLATVYITPTVAWKVNEQLGLALGLDIAFTEIELNRRTLTRFGGDLGSLDVIDSNIQGTSSLDYTPSLGALYKATDKLTFGLMYHHEKTLKIDDGELTLTNIAPAALSGTVDGMIDALGGPLHTGKTELRLPHMLSLAVAYQLTPQARVEFDAVHFGWSHFDELELDFGNPLLNQTIPEAYEDVWQFRVGGQYAVNERMTLLGGYVKDNSPQPLESMSPLLPDSDRNDYSIGVQYALSDRLTVTGTWMTVNFDERTNVVDGEQVVFEDEVADPVTGLYANPAGSYDSYANIFGVGIAYRF
jgi:long-chain fatty acid transport protein